MSPLNSFTKVVSMKPVHETKVQKKARKQQTSRAVVPTRHNPIRVCKLNVSYVEEKDKENFKY